MGAPQEAARRGLRGRELWQVQHKQRLVSTWVALVTHCLYCLLGHCGRHQQTAATRSALQLNAGVAAAVADVHAYACPCCWLQLVSRGLIPSNATNLGPASQARVASDVAGSTSSDVD